MNQLFYSLCSEFYWGFDLLLVCNFLMMILESLLSIYLFFFVFFSLWGFRFCDLAVQFLLESFSGSSLTHPVSLRIEDIFNIKMIWLHTKDSWKKTRSYQRCLLLLPFSYYDFYDMSGSISPNIFSRQSSYANKTILIG